MSLSWSIKAASTAIGTSLTSGAATTVSNTTTVAQIGILGFPTQQLSSWADSYSNTWTPIPIFIGIAQASGSTLTVASVISGQLFLGQIIAGTGVPSGARITAFGTGTGFTGTYTLSTSTSFASTTVSAAALTNGTTFTMATYHFLCPNFSGGTGHTFTAVISGGNEVISFNVAGFSGRANTPLGNYTSYADPTYLTSHPGALIATPLHTDLVSMNTLVDSKNSNSAGLFTAGSGWTIAESNVNGGTVSIPTMMQYQANVAAGSYAGLYTTAKFDASTGLTLALLALGSDRPRKRAHRTVHTHYVRH